MDIKDVVISIVLTALTYVLASWASGSYDPMDWNILTIIIAGIVTWNVWDPDED